MYYGGYAGSVEYSEEDAVFHGKVLGLRALISFEGESENAVAEDFRNAVDEYLYFCERTGKEPEKPQSSTFGVRALRAVGS
jgi:predicted HicB family RNase H-like nuclease